MGREETGFMACPGLGLDEMHVKNLRMRSLAIFRETWQYADGIRSTRLSVPLATTLVPKYDRNL